MQKSKLDKLRIDLKEARKLALEGIKDVKDGGSCNSDSVILHLPRLKEEKFQELMCEVGLTGYKSKRWGNVCFKITPTGSGMADKRLKSMEIMVDYLKKCEWDCSYFYQMD